MFLKRFADSLLLLVMLLSSTVNADNYRVRVDTGGESFDVDLELTPNQATSRFRGVASTFDLANMRWMNATTGEWVSEDNARRWAMQARRQVVSGIDSYVDEWQDFLEWAMVPKYSVRVTDGVMYLQSGHIDYELSGRIYGKDLESYLRYSRLDAYRTAMLMKRHPPYPEQLMLEYVRKFGAIPSRVKTTITKGGEITVMTVSITKQAAK